MNVSFTLSLSENLSKSLYDASVNYLQNESTRLVSCLELGANERIHLHAVLTVKPNSLLNGAERTRHYKRHMHKILPQYDELLKSNHSVQMKKLGKKQSFDLMAGGYFRKEDENHIAYSFYGGKYTYFNCQPEQFLYAATHYSKLKQDQKRLSLYNFLNIMVDWTKEHDIDRPFNYSDEDYFILIVQNMDEDGYSFDYLRGKTSDFHIKKFNAMLGHTKLNPDDYKKFLIPYN